MVDSPHNCAGTAELVCNCFLPVVDEDPHSLCSVCWGKECSTEDRRGECFEWSGHMWRKVSGYCFKWAAQMEKKERKDKSSSFSEFSPSMPVLLTCLSASFDSAVVVTVAASLDTCQVTYSTSYLIVSASHVSNGFYVPWAKQEEGACWIIFQCYERRNVGGNPEVLVGYPLRRSPAGHPGLSTSSSLDC